MTLLPGLVAAQGVPTHDAMAIVQGSQKLRHLAEDAGRQDAALGAHRRLSEIAAEQLRTLEALSASLGGGGQSVSRLEAGGAGVPAASAVYRIDDDAPMDRRLFGEPRQTIEAMIVEVAAEFAPATARLLSPTQFRALFQALVRQESAFDPHAESPVGAYGLTQLMPGTANDMGVDRYVPMENLRGGARYLTLQLEAFGTVELALAAYNAGPGRVRQYGGIPPFTETQTYVVRILAFYDTYMRRMAGPHVLGTLDPSDHARAEHANVSGAAGTYFEARFAEAGAMAARLAAILREIDGQGDVEAAMALNSYAWAEIGRLAVTALQLRAVSAEQESIAFMQIAVDQAAARRVAVMPVPN
ncbi:MAG: lytic transglycosylase domain-containing protein [Pseudomonadota bacterium]